MSFVKTLNNLRSRKAFAEFRKPDDKFPERAADEGLHSIGKSIPSNVDSPAVAVTFDRANRYRAKTCLFLWF